MKRSIGRAWRGAFALLLLQAGHPLQAEPPAEVAVSSGRFGVLRGEEDVEAGWELRFAPRRLRLLPERLPDLLPAAGAMATSQGTLYVYGGFRMDFPVGAQELWRVTPNWATGIYYTGEQGRDLAGALEFRSGVEVSRLLPNGARLGLCFYHISNGGLYERNPGSESLVLTYSSSLGSRFFLSP